MKALRSKWRKKVARYTYQVVRMLNDAGVDRFTVRQLFYQLVSRGILKSTRRDYKNFDALLVKLRDEDPWLDSQFIDTSKPRFNYYDRMYWAGQKYFVELWCEKDALRGFFEPYAKRYRVNLVICRGYPSVTRLREAKEQRHIPPNVKYVVLYFGDFDPSGEDIFRWINKELRPYNIVVRKVALTMEQVKKYRLPPRVPKKKDPRTPKFIKKYGEVAVELDALHPVILRDMIRRSLLKYMDIHKRLQVEVAEGIQSEAVEIVDEVLKNLRAKLLDIALRHVRHEINLALPKAYEMLLDALESGRDISLKQLYDREKVLDHVRNTMFRWFRT
ncbi:hypothetical protein DRO21_06815 [archaeon]|nr:MAG: hypothetical protein DRO21_06815 [archaeon]